MFGVPIGCAIVSLFFFWYYFFRNHTDTQSLISAIVGLIAGTIWFKTLYKGYKLMKIEERGGSALKDEQKTSEAPAAHYWKKFMWVVIVLFVIGLLIRYFLKF